MNRRGSLDTVLSDLLKEAHIWANEGTEKVARSITHEGRRILLDRTDTVISACFEEIARAISAHVTDILVKRLGLDEACADIEEGKNYQKHYESIRMKRELPPERQLTTSQSLPCAAVSPPQSPVNRPTNRATGRVVDHAPRYAQPLKRTRDRVRHDTLVRYHSENRLDRLKPPINLNETPLENRSSRLRKASVGKKLAARDRNSYHGRQSLENETNGKQADAFKTLDQGPSKDPLRPVQ